MECKCKQCGHEWIARTEKPKSCPACKRYDWDGKPASKTAQGEN